MHEFTMSHTLTILLQNEAGALAQMDGLFAARGYNIDTLTVAATADQSISRLILTLRGDDASIAQVLQQTRKLIDVVDVTQQPVMSDAV